MEARWLRLVPDGELKDAHLPVVGDIEIRTRPDEAWGRMTLKGRLVLDCGSGEPYIQVHPRHLSSVIQKRFPRASERFYTTVENNLIHMLYANDWRFHALAPFLHQHIAMQRTSRLGEPLPGTHVELHERMASFQGVGVYVAVLRGSHPKKCEPPIRAWAVFTSRYLRIYPTLNVAMRIFRMASGYNAHTKKHALSSAEHKEKQPVNKPESSYVSSLNEGGMTQEDMESLGIEEAPPEVIEDMAVYSETDDGYGEA